ncbi:MAG: ParB/RepB/Spo0J family partition protein [Gammaproteobacteria bacterium]
MESLRTETLMLEHQQLEQRFAALRLPDASALAALTRSLERSGQLTACIAVPARAGSAYVLLDGYRRVEALKRLRQDTVWVQVWQCPLGEGLGRLLARTQARRWAVIEEALLLRELAEDGGLSQHELARRTGRDVSWVNRRLQLLGTLSEELLAALCEGRLSSWAATRVLVPLARANSDHARALLDALGRQPLSTRELRRWYEHYIGANRTTRARLVEHPHLFVQAETHASETRAAERLREGPEGEWTRELERFARVAHRLCRALPALLPGGAGPELTAAFTAARRAFTRLEQEFERYVPREEGPPGAARDDPHAPCSGHAPAPHQPAAEALAQHRAAHPAGAPAG